MALTEHQAMIRDMARSFAQEKLAPHSAEWDRHSHFPTQAVAEMGERGVGFQSLSDPIDTTNAGGRLVLHMMGALAEFERALIVERTRAGLQAAKRRGVKLGRKPTLTSVQVAHARRGTQPRQVVRAEIIEDDRDRVHDDFPNSRRSLMRKSGHVNLPAQAWAARRISRFPTPRARWPR